MSLKRTYAGELSSTTITVENSSERDFSIQRDSNEIPPLKLRLKDLQESPFQKTLRDVSASLKKGERLNAISKISEIRICNLSKENAEELLRILKDILQNEHEKRIRGRALTAITKIIRVPNVSRVAIAEEIIDLVQQEGDHEIIVQYLKLLLALSQMIPAKADVVTKVLKTAYKKLVDSHQDVRCSALSLLSHICPTDNLKLNGGKLVDFPELFGEFSADQDPRVRSSALQALLTLHHRGHLLDLNVYERGSQALNDDYEAVRLAAVKLIWVLSGVYPERMLATTSSEKVRLVDDAFIKICNMVNDGSMTVRAEAMGLLGSLHLVSSIYLEQTLDKKLMSHLRKKKSAHEKERERFKGITDGGNSGWSTGRQWGANDPPTDRTLDEEEITLMNIGACGAFVRGLEDEFMEVRSAAIDSLCELANQNPSFAAMSCDFLVDMFNDEIEKIRLNSIHSLIKICEHVDLREEQLDTVLNVLNDFNWEIRESVRELLAHCKISTKACLHATILALMQNLKKYPQDKSHIWRCMKALGIRHSETVSILVPDLLSTHPFYAIPEPNLEDNEYTAMAILVFNATVKCPAIRALLPEHTKRHYDYLRDSLPQLVPELRPDAIVVSKSSMQDHNEIMQFYQKALERGRSVGKFDLGQACKILKVCMKDLDYVEAVSSQLAPNARFQALYLRCVKMLFKVRNERTWTVATPIAFENSGVLTYAVEELLSLSYRLEHGFLGLGSHDCASVKLMRVLAHCLQMVLTSRSSSIKSMDRKQHDLDCLQLFLSRIRHFRESIAGVETSDDAGLQLILRCEKLLEEGSYSMTKAVSNLQGLLLNCSLRSINVENPLREAKAIINEPDGTSDAVLKFTAGLTLGVQLDACLMNLDDTSNVLIQVVYPDLKRHLIKPKPSDFRRLSHLKYRLVTTVIISHQTWSDSSAIQISLVLKHPTDVDEEKVLSFLQPKFSADKIVRTSKSSKHDVTHGVMSLCDPVKLNIQPKTSCR